MTLRVEFIDHFDLRTGEQRQVAVPIPLVCRCGHKFGRREDVIVETVDDGTEALQHQVHCFRCGR